MTYKRHFILFLTMLFPGLIGFCVSKFTNNMTVITSVVIVVSLLNAVVILFLCFAWMAGGEEKNKGDSSGK